MPTTNPVPSQDPSDLLFNAGKLDEVVNGTSNSFTDRLGVARRTVAGMNADFDAQLADAESDLNVYRADAAASAAEALGYLQTIRATSYGAYAEDPTTDPLGNPPTVGDEYFNTTSNLLKRWNGTTWQASDINTANLAASSGSSLVGYDGGTVQDVLDSARPMANYTALRAYTGRATSIRITQIGLAGFFSRDASDTDSADNGGTVIVDVSGRRWKRVYDGVLNLKWFGARGDWNGSTGTDDAIAIQAAISAAYGKTLYVPFGAYFVNTVVNSALLSISGRIRIVADFGASFVYGPAADVSTDVIRIDPSTVADEGVEIEGLWIYEKSGAPARDVIRIRLDATHGLKKLRLTNCLFRSKNGYAVSCFNSTYLNTNGLFFTDIDKCELVGGFYSDGHGDTTRIANSVFTGQNRGIEIEMLPASAGNGASSSLSIINNNITSTGGAIFIRRGRNVMIENNNIEQLTDFSGNYCIQLNNVDYDITGVSWVRGNKIEPNDPVSKCGGIGLYRCKKTLVEGNQIGTSAKTSGTTIGAALSECSDVGIFYNNLYISDNCWGVYITSACANISYKPGKISNFNSNYIEVLDEGIGTKGVFKTPTFENSWTNAAGTAYQAARFVKRDEGDVLLEGVIASGTLTGDTTMFTLPDGFRPAKRLTFITTTLTSGGAFGQVVVRIDPDGTVRMRNASTGGIQLLELSLCGINFNALLA